MTESPLVSVIIPCYNQGRYLAEAIESALNQSYRPREVIVVDDGSTDDSSHIAARYIGVDLIRQRNRGLAAARNAGLNASGGDYLVFLDADDRLLPDALETGIDRLTAHRKCAFAYGCYGLIAEDGTQIYSPKRDCVQGEPFLRLLSSNYIGMHATVMYRREIFDDVGRFDTSLAACEDYDMFLRITRNHPIYFHGKTVAEYRQHDSSMSRNANLMLKHSLLVLSSQWKYAGGNKRAREAYREGIVNWQDYYGKRLIRAVGLQVRAREWRRAIGGALTLLKYYPRGVANKVIGISRRLMSHAPRFFSIKASR